MYAYIRFEKKLIVGFYTPAGVWTPESSYTNQHEAAARVSYLNGGSPESKTK